MKVVKLKTRAVFQKLVLWCAFMMLTASATATASDILITAEGYEIGAGDMVALITPGGQGSALHAGPGTEHAMLGHIAEGDFIEFQRLQGDWALVWHLDSDSEGWVPRAALGLPDEAGAPPLLVIEAPSPGWLPMHTGPGTDYPEARRLFTGMVVDHVDTKGDWLQILLADGTSGWIPSAGARSFHVD